MSALAEAAREALRLLTDNLEGASRAPWWQPTRRCVADLRAALAAPESNSPGIPDSSPLVELAYAVAGSHDCHYDLVLQARAALAAVGLPTRKAA